MFAKDSRVLNVFEWISYEVEAFNISLIKMNFDTKVEFCALLIALLQHFVSSTADNEFNMQKCPEFNPQNELDIELVRKLFPHN